MLGSIKLIILPIFSLAILSGCGTDVLTNENLNIFGTKAVVEEEPFQTIDLALVLQPEMKLSNSLATVENQASEAKRRYALESAF